VTLLFLAGFLLIAPGCMQLGLVCEVGRAEKLGYS